MSKQYSDGDIIQAVQVGDPTFRDHVLSWLYGQQYPLIAQYVLKNNGSEADAADVFQDAMVIFYQKVRTNKFLGQSSIGTYLYAVARNLWLKKLRKSRFDLSKIEVEESYSFDEETIIQSAQLTMREALEQIGEACKKLLMDFYYHNKTMEVLMETYKLGSNEAARNKKYRCMQRLISFVNENRLKRTDFAIE
ncbi:hypothetical protein BFP97_13235 [Roseivirga sp. 4D4]|uniref:RNA polymerase sigma factor n=1 Tax=Roseivirga sp. 4D4 TaxID=1889784 RepID=UPI0008531F7E|nr:sigma-70 family RNA polymerase sigma factor [Roseivirga sp. 4D4]OEK02426.1 hypothetical protein BFP97_13235 [Roseivirga sp. 4D4]